MAADIRISQRLSQSLMMTPQLQQAIKLLQLSRQELETFVAEQLNENPTLEESSSESHEESVESERAKETTAEEFMERQLESTNDSVDKVAGESVSDSGDWEQGASAHDNAPPQPSTVRKSGSGDDDAPNYENIVTRGKTLQEYLIGQIGELEFSEEEQKAAQLIIGNIDERGYLCQPLAELQETEKLDLDMLEGVLDTIQRLDPPGVGARDLKECLMIQVRQSHLRNGIIEKIIENHLPELENRNFAVIAKALKITTDEVIINVQLITELDPIPGRQFTIDASQYVIPDVYVSKFGKEWRVSLNDEGMPKLHVSKLYKEMATGSETKGKDKEYIKDKVKSAQWLISAIYERQKTIFKVTECIVRRQIDFFEMGTQYLKPMILKDVAEDVELHESTISRVTRNKYMHTPRGIFELKYFFNSAVGTSDGDSMASEAVKNRIAEMIKAEDAKHPLSDQEIADQLDKEKIQVARRTVAKYRETLGILPSSKRKKYF
jgi:RNA polymerase sigma-54 factor